MYQTVRSFTRFALALAITLGLIGTLACGRSGTAEHRESSSTPAKPRRIVSQVLNVDEILLAICPPDRIVGVSKFARSAA